MGVDAIASAEFVSLCRAQLTLLNDSFGATLAIVYLAQHGGQNERPMQLVPVAMYPERITAERMLTPAVSMDSETVDSAANAANWELAPQSMPPSVEVPAAIARPAAPRSGDQPQALEQTAVSNAQDHAPANRLVRPLVQDDHVWGVLALDRQGVPWTTWEQEQIDRIVHTLTLACTLDRRQQWFEVNYNAQQQLADRQRDLLHNLLHQLRNPLTAVRTFGKLLLRRMQGDDRNRDIANNLLRESERLQTIALQVVQAIDLTEPSAAGAEGPVMDRAAAALPNAGGESAGYPLALLPGKGAAAGSASEVATIDATCNPAEVWDGAVAAAAAVASERSRSLQTRAPEDWPVVVGDAGVLREVLSNLLDNAIKYSEPGGHVSAVVRVGSPQSATAPVGRAPKSIAPTPNQPHLVIAIANSGPPIPSDDLPHIFSRHYRGSQAAGAIDGSGLGLAIVRELTERMGGAIELFSPKIVLDARDRGLIPIPAAEHQGTTILLWLPVAD